MSAMSKNLSAARVFADIPDFCVSLGGDGTVLYTASLFSEDAALPPMLAFAMGTLGFLTAFSATNFEPLMDRCAPTVATLRQRCSCCRVCVLCARALLHAPCTRASLLKASWPSSVQSTYRVLV